MNKKNGHINQNVNGDNNLKHEGVFVLSCMSSFGIPFPLFGYNIIKALYIRRFVLFLVVSDYHSFM